MAPPSTLLAAMALLGLLARTAALPPVILNPTSRRSVFTRHGFVESLVAAVAVPHAAIAATEDDVFSSATFSAAGERKTAAPEGKPDSAPPSPPPPPASDMEAMLRAADARTGSSDPRAPGR